jgi:3-hydroxymyristoyl/3-hydroxydecanoyl-(acyl carrier protein) dehydratase
MDADRLLRTYRKKPLALLSDRATQASFTPLDYGRGDIARIIPHREPFLLLDRLTGLDLREGEEVIFGERTVSGRDPVFTGHFPGNPIYPGSLQLEMGGQLGLCLTYFALNHRVSIPAEAKPIAARATKVLGALFLAPVSPETRLTLCSRRLEYDGLSGRVISQVMADDRICCVGISEVVFLDEG